MPIQAFFLPQVRSIAFTRPLAWLALGWRDMVRAGAISVVHGVLLAGLGMVIAAVAHDRFWLLAGALSGFLVVAPVLATSFYVLSRSLERGEPANAAAVVRTWLFWQSSHRDTKWGNDYWCLVQFGALLALAATGWVLISSALITLLAPAPIRTPADFIVHVVLAQDSTLFTLWLALGSLLAAPIFASSVVSIPLLLDRQASLWQAVLTSWQTVLANPATMAMWTAIILALTMLGMATLLIGLAVVMPLLGHASWHAYRDLVDASSLPQREPGGPAAGEDATQRNGMAS